MVSAARRRKIMLGAGLVVAGPVIALICLPVWFPWVLHPLARHQGLGYSAYERVGYSRFALHNVSFTNQSINLNAERVEAELPTLWVWRCLKHQESLHPASLYVSKWRLTLLPGETATGSTFSKFDELVSTLRTLKRSVPGAVLSNGTVRAQTTELAFPHTSWSEGKLSSEVRFPWDAWPAARVLATGSTNPPSSGEFSFWLQVAPGRPATSGSSEPPVCRAQFRSDPLQLRSDFAFFTSTAGLEVRNTNIVRGNTIGLQAQFGQEGMLPATGSLQTTNFQLPPTWLSLPGFEPIEVSASAIWNTGLFTADLAASAQPKTANPEWPPIRASLQAKGDTNSNGHCIAYFSRAGLRRGL